MNQNKNEFKDNRKYIVYPFDSINRTIAEDFSLNHKDLENYLNNDIPDGYCLIFITDKFLVLKKNENVDNSNLSTPLK